MNLAAAEHKTYWLVGRSTAVAWLSCWIGRSAARVALGLKVRVRGNMSGQHTSSTTVAVIRRRITRLLWWVAARSTVWWLLLRWESTWLLRWISRLLWRVATRSTVWWLLLWRVSNRLLRWITRLLRGITGLLRIGGSTCRSYRKTARLIIRRVWIGWRVVVARLSGVRVVAVRVVVIDKLKFVIRI